LKPASLTVRGKKKDVVFKFDFEGMSLEQVCAISAKDITTDLQNNTRVGGQDSEQRRANKVALMESFIAETEEKGFVDIKVANMAKRMRISAPLTTRQAINAVDPQRLTEDEIKILQEKIDAAKAAKKATKKA
jgi:hypothetical protein